MSYTENLIKQRAAEKVAGFLTGAGQVLGGAVSTAGLPAAAGVLLGLAYEDLAGDPGHDIVDYNKSMATGAMLGLGAGGLYGAAKTYFKRVPAKIKAIQDQIDKLTNTSSVQQIKKDLNTWQEIAKGSKLEKPMHSAEKLEELLKYHTAKNESAVKNLRKQIEFFNNGGFWENAWETSGW